MSNKRDLNAPSEGAPTPASDVYCIPEIAKRLGISRGLAYELVRTGVVPSLPLGRRRVVVPRAAFEDFLRRPKER